MAASPKYLAGVDLGGTNMQIGVLSPEGKDEMRLLAPAKRKTRADEGLDEVLNRIVGGIEEACSLAKITTQQLGGVGVGAPGAVDPDRGVVLEAVNLRWSEVNVAQLLTRRLKVPVFLDNDVNVALLGEHRMGAAKGVRHCLGVWVGTGIGGGLIFDDKLFYGHFFTAGEIGHTILLPTNPAGHRSLEHNCSRTAVADRIARLVKGNRKSSIMKDIGDDYEKIKSRAIAKAYAEGDGLVVEVVDEAADLLGVSIAGVVTLLSLPRVVLGGGLTEAIGKPFVERVKASVRKFAFPDVCKKVEVVASKLEDNAGVYGAAYVALERLK